MWLLVYSGFVAQLFSLTAHFFLVRAKRASVVTIPSRGKVQTDRSRFKSLTFYEAEGRIIGAAMMRYSHKGDKWEQIRNNCKRSAFFTRWQHGTDRSRVCLSSVYSCTRKRCLLPRLFFAAEFRWHHLSNKTRAGQPKCRHTESLFGLFFSPTGLYSQEFTTHLSLSAAGYRWQTYDSLMCVCGNVSRLCPGKQG